MVVVVVVVVVAVVVQADGSLRGPLPPCAAVEGRGMVVAVVLVVAVDA